MYKKFFFIFFLFYLFLTFKVTIYANNVNEKENINNIIEENLKESSDKFIENTSEDLKMHFEKELESKQKEITKSFNFKKFIEFLRDNFFAFTTSIQNQIVNFLREKFA